MICWKCGKEISVSEIYRTTECPECHGDLHCCKGCKFYEPGSHYDCKENVDNLVVDKEKSNFCDYFMVNVSPKTANKKSEDAKAAFNALFGGGLCL